MQRADSPRDWISEPDKPVTTGGQVKISMHTWRRGDSLPIEGWSILRSKEKKLSSL